MLHIVNKSPGERQALASCLRMAQDGSAVLLIEDGVYAALQGSDGSAGLQAATARLKVYALKPDRDARGISSRVIEGVTTVDYTGFVDLVARHPTNQSWL